jgi:hypothetical protein
MTVEVAAGATTIEGMSPAEWVRKVLDAWRAAGLPDRTAAGDRRHPLTVTARATDQPPKTVAVP